MTSRMFHARFQRLLCFGGPGILVLVQFIAFSGEVSTLAAGIGVEPAATKGRTSPQVVAKGDESVLAPGLRLPALRLPEEDHGRQGIRGFLASAMQNQPLPAPPDQTPPSPETEAQRATAQARFDRLRKPMSQIRLPTAYLREVRPVDQAAELIDVTDPVLVSGGDAGVVLAPRYPEPFCHQPLYFEDPNLERCGLSHGFWQNAVSSIRFISDTLTLPCSVATVPPCRLVPTLGDCRTCERFPSRFETLRAGEGPKVKGLISQAAAVAGFSLLLL